MNKEPAPKRAYKRHESDFKRRVPEHRKASKRTAAQVESKFDVSTSANTRGQNARMFQIQRRLMHMKEGREKITGPSWPMKSG